MVNNLDIFRTTSNNTDSKKIFSVFIINRRSAQICHFITPSFVHPYLTVYPFVLAMVVQGWNFSEIYYKFHCRLLDHKRIQQDLVKMSQIVISTMANTGFTLMKLI